MKNLKTIASVATFLASLVTIYSLFQEDSLSVNAPLNQNMPVSRQFEQKREKIKEIPIPNPQENPPSKSGSPPPATVYEISTNHPRTIQPISATVSVDFPNLEGFSFPRLTVSSDSGKLLQDFVQVGTSLQLKSHMIHILGVDFESEAVQIRVSQKRSKN